METNNHPVLTTANGAPIGLQQATAAGHPVVEEGRHSLIPSFVATWTNGKPDLPRLNSKFFNESFS